MFIQIILGHVNIQTSNELNGEIAIKPCDQISWSTPMTHETSGYHACNYTLGCNVLALVETESLKENFKNDASY